MSPTRPNATNADILAMLRDGYSNLRISRELRVDKSRVARLRREHGLPQVALQPLTLEQKWASKTRPVDGGHLAWGGERNTSAGTPTMRYKEASYSPAAIAFEIRHGRTPQGYVKAECGYPHCVAPDHVDDEAGRQQARMKLRAERGISDLPSTCISGHDLTEHAKLEADGRAYCGMCKVIDKRAERDPSAPRRERRRAESLEQAFTRYAVPADDGHVQWSGSTSHDTPTLWFGGTKHSVYKVAFRIEHGREPQGTVTSGCDMPHCVAGAHVEDQPMREAKRQSEQRLDRLFAGIFGAAA
ncbi:hypothetical protein P1S61_37735 [Streptomyces sp. ME08-AFT2]|uniref:hypothetical protein n=1 Tax=Streptomyces sp. ME08-AFT2 TaxID=3028683 RepID=UPI0029BDCDB6|nr:hypothetical protein [Streptomyces sp. ME08-AFT2]MDX3314700.1 hypothetical protein [Streptomyces sp. ME08-AFT2]